MTRKDDAPDFVAVIGRHGGPLHLSEDGNYTLCGLVVLSHWFQYDERVALFTVRLSGMELCPRCEKLAQEAAP